MLGAGPNKARKPQLQHCEFCMVALDVASVPCHHPDVRADRRREISAVVTAFVAHVLFLTLAPKTPFFVEEEPPPVLVDVKADTTIEIDSATNSEANPVAAMPGTRIPTETTSPTSAPTSAPTPAPEAAAPPSPRMPAPSEDSEAEDEPEQPTPVPSSPSVAEGSAPAESGPVKPAPGTPSPDEYGSLPSPDLAPDSAPIVPGLSGPLWSIPGVVPSTAAPKPAPTTITAAPTVPSDVASRVLSGTLHSHDKALGIDVPAAGVVAGSVADALRHSALTDVKGTFEVKLSGDGNVESVRFVGSNDGDASQWAAVADAAKRSLAGRSLQMGPDKQGVTVVVKVESKVQYPAGTQKRVDVKPVCANEVIEQMAAAIEGAMQPGGVVRGVRDDQGKFIPYDELDDERRTRFCIPIGIRAVVDPANIGAHMTNVVSSSFQVKRAGEQALPADAAMPIDRGAPWMPVAQGKTRPPPPPPKKKWKKKKPRRGSVVPVQINREQ
jgi:hypothetical protein